MNFRTAATCLVLLAAWMTPVVAAPQTPQLPTRSSTPINFGVRAGQRVSVLTMAGRIVDGKVAAVDEDNLVVNTAAGTVSIPRDSVREVQADYNDSLKNGALYGLITGVAIGGLYYAAGVSAFGCSNMTWSCGEWTTMVFAFSAGIGTAAGMGVDRAFRSRHTVYRAGGSRPSLIVAPLLGPHRSGVVACLRW